jgi:hypothetical protein
VIYFFDNCISHKMVQILRLAGAEDSPKGEDPGPHKLVHLLDVPELPRRGATPDTEWIPYAAEQGWMALTADHRIRRKPQERKVFSDAKLRTPFVSDAVTQSGRWDQAKFWVNHWWAIVRDTNRCARGDLFQVDAHGKVQQLHPVQASKQER